MHLHLTFPLAVLWQVAREEGLGRVLSHDDVGLSKERAIWDQI